MKRCIFCLFTLLIYGNCVAQTDSSFHEKNHLALLFEPSAGVSSAFSKSHPQYEFNPYYRYGYSLKIGLVSKKKIGVFTGINVENRGVSGIYSYTFSLNSWGPSEEEIAYSGHVNSIGIPVFMLFPVKGNLYLTTSINPSLLRSIRYSKYENSKSINEGASLLGRKISYENASLQERFQLNWTIGVSQVFYLGDNFMLQYGGQFSLYDISSFEYRTNKIFTYSAEITLAIGLIK